MFVVEFNNWRWKTNEKKHRFDVYGWLTPSVSGRFRLGLRVGKDGSAEVAMALMDSLFYPAKSVSDIGFRTWWGAHMRGKFREWGFTEGEYETLYRVVGGAYDGTVFILSFSPTRPLRLRHWGLHRASGTRQIGGGIVSEPAEGQWDPLLPWGSTDPVEWPIQSDSSRI